MKNVIRFFLFSAILFGVLSNAACSESSKQAATVDMNDEKSAQEEVMQQTEELKTAKKSNDVLIDQIFDTLSSEGILLVVKRNKTLEEKIVDSVSSKKSLTSLQAYFRKDNVNKIDEDNVGKISGYIDSLLSLKENIKQYGSKSEFISKTNSILSSEVYVDDIYKSNDDKPEYIAFNALMEEKILIAQNKFHETRKFPSEGQLAKTIDTDVSKNTQAMDFQLYFYMVTGLLLISLIVNGLLFSSLKKSKQQVVKLKKEIVDAARLNPMNTLRKNTALPQKFKIQDHMVEEKFKVIQQELATSYGAACMRSQQGEIEKYRTNLLTEIEDREFNTKEEADEFLSKKLNSIKDSLTEKLKECVDRDSAIKRVNQSISTDKLCETYESDLIKPSEIAVIADQQRNLLIQELPTTCTKDKLKLSIQSTLKSINKKIEHHILENSEFYFPFADSNGMLPHAKGSKAKERNSALKLTIQPKNTAKASFRLLYDYDDMMRGGIQSYDKLLLPICNLSAENFNRNGTTVQPVDGSEGEMELDGEVWKVTKKLNVRIV